MTPLLWFLAGAWTTAAIAALTLFMLHVLDERRSDSMAEAWNICDADDWPLPSTAWLTNFGADDWPTNDYVMRAEPPPQFIVGDNFAAWIANYHVTPGPQFDLVGALLDAEREANPASFEGEPYFRFDANAQGASDAFYHGEVEPRLAPLNPVPVTIEAEPYVRYDAERDPKLHFDASYLLTDNVPRSRPKLDLVAVNDDYEAEHYRHLNVEPDDAA